MALDRRSCSTFIEAAPSLAGALRKGPGTWNRKPLKKKEATEFDNLLSGVAQMPEVEDVRKDLQSIAKELKDMTPKSLKATLTSPKAFEAAPA